MKNKHIKKFESIINDIELLFTPSGEIINISKKELEKLDDYVIINFNNDYGLYTIEDDYKDVIMMALNKNY